MMSFVSCNLPAETLPDNLSANNHAYEYVEKLVRTNDEQLHPRSDDRDATL